MTNETATLTDNQPAVTGFDAIPIPVPRSGRSYDLYLAEVFDGRWGCLDAPTDV